MTVKREITIGDIVSSLALPVAAAGLFFTWYQIRRDSMRNRSEFAANLVYRFMEDPDTAETFYRLEHEKLKYSENFQGSPDEVKLDKLLYHFEKIASLYEMSAITIEDVMLLDYEFIQFHQNAAVQQYLAGLDDWCKSVAGRRAFPRFRRVAEQIERLRNRDKSQTSIRQAL